MGNDSLPNHKLMAPHVTSSSKRISKNFCVYTNIWDTYAFDECYCFRESPVEVVNLLPTLKKSWDTVVYL